MNKTPLNWGKAALPFYFSLMTIHCFVYDAICMEEFFVGANAFALLIFHGSGVFFFACSCVRIVNLFK